MIRADMKTETIFAIAAGLVALSFIFRKRKMKERMMQIAKDEMIFWKNGLIKEGAATHRQRLADYWRAAGIMNWPMQRMIDEPWSAAFISYVVKKAGAGSDFKYGPSHTVFWQAAKKNRSENNQNPFKAYRINEGKPAPGDIIMRGRQAGITYDTSGYFKSHSDIVISVTPDQALVIGGNLSNSVRMYGIPLTDGFIDNTKIRDGYPFIGYIKVSK